MIDIREKDGSVFFTVRVQPRSSRSQLCGEYDGGVKLRLKSPPVEGAANLECCRFLAKILGVPRSCVEIVSGQQGRRKTVRVQGLSSPALAGKIAAHL